MIPKDPAMLLSFLNMKLRDEYQTLDHLCEDLDLNKEEVLLKMLAADYEYNPTINQFK